MMVVKCYKLFNHRTKMFGNYILLMEGHNWYCSSALRDLNICHQSLRVKLLKTIILIKICCILSEEGYSVESKFRSSEGELVLTVGTFDWVGQRKQPSWRILSGGLWLVGGHGLHVHGDPRHASHQAKRRHSADTLQKLQHFTWNNQDILIFS